MGKSVSPCLRGAELHFVGYFAVRRVGPLGRPPQLALAGNLALDIAAQVKIKGKL